MWKFKPFGHKEQTGLEGRIIDIGNLKVQIRNIIAEGGFSCVYLARDAINGSKQYALKHIICNDEESLQLVMKEISVLKTLKGHPNVVPLLGHALFDMGRTKEAFLLMEYCEKSLVTVLESRGAGFFEEKQVLTLFRDICNAVFAMHCQSPPIAHRDLKAENLLLGSDGLWKLCDFGSTSTNHKVFDKPEEMGIEEDNIRKHTTPAYRSPEMWDLFRRELINEKVDIWALGCLLFRICYLKSAFDGESKLQILNGNYRIPELPKYSTLVTDLIRDMLQSSPGDRPDITQVWFRVNDLLPESLQKSLPDRPPEMPQHSSDAHAGTPRPANKTSPVPRRSPPPPPPSSEPPQNSSSASNNSRTGETAAPLGAFWTTQHAKDSDITPQKEQTFQSPNVQKNTQTKDLNLFPDNLNHTERLKQPKQNDAYNSFVAEFDVPSNNHHKPEKEEKLEAEVEKLKEQLAHVSAEKAEVTSKYEKLTSICRSQRQEIQDLKNALNAKTPSPSRDSSRNTASRGSQSSTTPPNEKIEGTVWELQQGFFDRGSASSDSQKWKPFAADDSNKPQTVPTNNSATSVRTRSGKNWGFETDSFKVVPTAGGSSKVNKPIGELSSSQRFGTSKSTESKVENQPAGWAGF